MREGEVAQLLADIQHAVVGAGPVAVDPGRRAGVRLDVHDVPAGASAHVVSESAIEVCLLAGVAVPGVTRRVIGRQRIGAEREGTLGDGEVRGRIESGSVDRNVVTVVQTSYRASQSPAQRCSRSACTTGQEARHCRLRRSTRHQPSDRRQDDGRHHHEMEPAASLQLFRPGQAIPPRGIDTFPWADHALQHTAMAIGRFRHPGTNVFTSLSPATG